MIAEEKNIAKILQDIELQKKMRPGAWVVKHEGKVLTMASGKSIWKQSGHAKTALINHFEAIYNWQEVEALGFKNAKAVAHYLLEEKILIVEQL